MTTDLGVLPLTIHLDGQLFPPTIFLRARRGSKRGYKHRNVNIDYVDAGNEDSRSKISRRKSSKTRRSRCTDQPMRFARYCSYVSCSVSAVPRLKSRKRELTSGTEPDVLDRFDLAILIDASDGKPSDPTNFLRHCIVGSLKEVEEVIELPATTVNMRDSSL